MQFSPFFARTITALNEGAAFPQDAFDRSLSPGPNFAPSDRHCWRWRDPPSLTAFGEGLPHFPFAMKARLDDCRTDLSLSVCPDFSRFLLPAARSGMATIALGYLLLAGTPAARAQERAGVIEGRVFNAATGLSLGNARVTLEGTNRDAITDESGSFRFSSKWSAPRPPLNSWSSTVWRATPAS